jgi:hypothetical protein
MRVFSMAQAADGRQADLQGFASRGNGTFLAASPAGAREEMVHSDDERLQPHSGRKSA